MSSNLHIQCTIVHLSTTWLSRECLGVSTVIGKPACQHTSSTSPLMMPEQCPAHRERVSLVTPLEYECIQKLCSTTSQWQVICCKQISIRLWNIPSTRKDKYKNTAQNLSQWHSVKNIRCLIDTPSTQFDLFKTLSDSWKCIYRKIQKIFSEHASR